MGAGRERVDITKPDLLAPAVASADAVLWAVQYAKPDAADVETRAVAALSEALTERKRAFLFISGAWIYGDTHGSVVDETSPIHPAAIVAHRPQLEAMVRAGAARGVRSIIIRPGNVYGRAGGMPAMWVESAKKNGAARMVGDGSNHWPLVHVDDLAALVALAFQHAKADTLYNATDETAFTVREMATAASRGAGAGGAVLAWPLNEARSALGAPFADALVLDSKITSLKARETFDWAPRAPNILNDLESGSYANAKNT